MAGVIRPNPTSGMPYVVMDSGVLIANFYKKMMAVTDYAGFIDLYHDEMDTENYLGITRGGTSSSLESDERIMEYDGRRVRSVGDSTVDSANPQISTTLLVHSVDNLQRVMPMSDVTFENGRYNIKTRLGTPTEADHMDDLCWIREMKGGGFKIGVLHKARNTADYSQTGADRSESEIPVTFTAFAKTWDDTAYAPMEEIIFPHPSQLDPEIPETPSLSTP